jgi:hypothetical protein
LIVVFGAFIYPNVRRDDSIADNFFGTTVSKRAFKPLEVFNIYIFFFYVLSSHSNGEQTFL